MTTRISDCKRTLEDSLSDSSKPWTSIFDYLEEKTKCKRLYIFCGLIAALGLYLVFGYAAQLLCNALATVYPAYASLKAIESPQTGDDKKWLTYWTVYAIFTLVDYPCDLLLHWIPIYWLIKFVIMVWLFLPSEHLNGATILYNNVIRPKFLQCEGDVDNIISRMAEKFGSKVIPEKLLKSN